MLERNILERKIGILKMARIPFIATMHYLMHY
jgi:hypothetical protein